MIGPWACDKCGEIIEKAEDGVFQYLARGIDDRRVGRDPVIVHHFTKSPLSGRYRCYHDEAAERQKDGSIFADLSLARFVGPDGLVTLLSLLEDNILTPQELNPIIMRLHVPGYEQARFYFGIAVSTGFVDRNMPDGYFLTEEIERIIGAIPSLKAKMGG
jgi:hypothetical protein